MTEERKSAATPLGEIFKTAASTLKLEPILVTPYLLFFLGLNIAKHFFPENSSGEENLTLLNHWPFFLAFAIANCLIWAWMSQLNHSWITTKTIDIRHSLVKTAEQSVKLLIGMAIASIPNVLFLGLMGLLTQLGFSGFVSLVSILVFPLINFLTFGLFQFLPYHLIQTENNLRKTLSNSLSFFLKDTTRILRLTLLLFILKLLAIIPVSLTLTIPVLGEGLIAGVLQGAIHSFSALVVAFFFYDSALKKGS